MSKKLILGVVVAVVVAGGCYYFYTNSVQYIAENGKTVYVDGPRGGEVKVENVGRRIALDRPTEGEVISVGSGLSQYTSNELGLSFQYPSTWSLTEQAHNKLASGSEGQASVRIEGDGYFVDFTTKGTEYPGGVDTRTPAYTVSGREARAFEDKLGSGFMLSIFDACNMAINITSPVASKVVTDKIIASVKCSAE